MVHFLLFKYGVSYKTLVNASQGDNSKEIAEAQRMLDEVSAAFAEADRTAKAAAAALKEANARATEATTRENAALAAEAEAREQEAPFKKAQEEVDAALSDVRSQEATRDNKTAELQQKSTEGGVVSQNRAKAELAQHLAEDPLPLRKAKITLEAAYKKAEKARAPFEAATKAAEAARAIASQAAAAARAAKDASEKAKRAADAAVDDASRRVAEAEAYLDEIRSRPGCAHGALWWMDRELTEQKAYLPESKGGYKKTK
jgi:chromosome segregation ATPase